MGWLGQVICLLVIVIALEELPSSEPIADRMALEEFRKNSDRWKRYVDLASRQAALARFHDYAYQWY